MRWRNDRPGETTLHAKLNVAINDCSSRRLQDRLRYNCSRVVCSLSILIVSDKTPINSITCEGACVLPWAIGMLIFWKVGNKFVKLCWQRLLWGGNTHGESIRRKHPLCGTQRRYYIYSAGSIQGHLRVAWRWKGQYLNQKGESYHSNTALLNAYLRARSHLDE